ncbi:hypothetical protein HD597_004606 [Nonomuraea thailandensis]|uniref:Uncharacterized protein n=1 Tax=Nonomuraea thailandensis TaxID=1188745 RepID=A0A9X2GL73_9ACTN|nr:hypothetical protein [Nonomuraea thailandensis]MCP2357586.1 hypothetical protein [Nonomuraea thailandensis]
MTTILSTSAGPDSRLFNDATTTAKAAREALLLVELLAVLGDGEQDLLALSRAGAVAFLGSSRSAGRRAAACTSDSVIFVPARASKRLRRNHS